MNLIGPKLFFFLVILEMGLIVGNKAKGRISKQVLPENKARQTFQKVKIFNPLIRRWLRNVENFVGFVFL